MKVRWLYFALFLLLVALAGCGDGRTSDELRRVAEVVNDNPELALARLDSVELSALNSADRHYFDFLSIKAADKAYIMHQSDSLIRSVIDYYQDRPDDELLPEVLYYGGRVYFDLGDAPQALHYFQQALDRVPTSDLELRGRIVSQMGRLYFMEFLHTHAIEKLKESIEIDKLLNDTYGLTYDNRLLGRIYNSLEQYDSALFYYSCGLNNAMSLSAEDIALLKIAYADGLSKNGRNIDARAVLIPALLDSLSRPFYYPALADYINVYYATNEYEYVEKFARELLNSDVNIALKSVAYGALVEIGIVTNNVDSLYEYIKCYKLAVDSINNTLSKDEVHYQNSYFNYSLRERDNLRLTKEKHTRDIIIIISICALIILLLFIRSKMAKAKADNLKAVEAIRMLKIELTEKNRHISDLSDAIGANEAEKDEFSTKIVNLFAKQFELLDDLTNIYYETDGSAKSKDKIYRQVKAEIESFGNEGYPQLENLVNTYKENIMALLRSEINLKEEDYRLLCYCFAGFSTKSISVFTGRSTTNVSTRKWRLKSEIAKQNPQNCELFMQHLG